MPGRSEKSAFQKCLPRCIPSPIYENNALQTRTPLLWPCISTTRESIRRDGLSDKQVRVNTLQYVRSCRRHTSR